MNRSDIATVLRARTPYRVTTRPGAVVAWLDPWHAAIVRTGKNPTVVATIPDPRMMFLFVIASFLTLGIASFLWLQNRKSDYGVREIRSVFRRELGVITQ